MFDKQQRRVIDESALEEILEAYEAKIHNRLDECKGDSPTQQVERSIESLSLASICREMGVPYGPVKRAIFSSEPLRQHYTDIEEQYDELVRGIVRDQALRGEKAAIQMHLQGHTKRNAGLLEGKTASALSGPALPPKLAQKVNVEDVEHLQRLERSKLLEGHG